MKEKILVFGDKVREKLIRWDSFVNPFTGLGTTRDKTTQAYFTQSTRLSDEVLDNIYHDNGIAARICDALPEDALRQGFDLIIDSGEAEGGTITDPVEYDKIQTEREISAAEAAETSQAILDRLDDLDTKAKFLDAAIWARVFGGSAVYVGADDGAVEEGLREPLNEDGIKTLDHLNVFDKRYLMPSKWYEDPATAKFGQVELYRISPEISIGTAGAQSVEVHESRLIVFSGVRTSVKRKQGNSGWSESLLQRIYETLRNFSISWQALANLIQDANQGVFKMHGLISALAAKESDIVQARLALLDMSRSVARAVVLDSESEEFDRQNFSWSGVQEPFNLLMLKLAAEAKMPVTKLMGREPAGMNATGESDMRNWYDTVKSYQTDDLTPRLERLIYLLMRAKDGPTGGRPVERWRVEFPSLWQADPKEEAEIRQIQSVADKHYAEIGALLPEEIAISRFTADGWSDETKIDISSRLAALEADENAINSPNSVDGETETSRGGSVDESEDPQG